MDRCDVEIVLADGTTACGGDVIEGFVAITASRKATCRDVILTLSWRTAGKGTVTGNTVMTESLFSGDLAAEDRRLLPFAVPVPVGPFSYDGTVTSLHWDLRADVDVAWARDAHAQQVLTVVPPETLRDADFTLNLSAHDTIDIGSLQSLFRVVGCFGVAFGALVFFSGVVALVALLADPALEAPVTIPLFVAVAGVFIALISAAVAAGFAARPTLSANTGLQAVARAAPGDAIDLRFSLQPNVDMVVDAVTVTLVCEEVAVSTHGTQRITARHEVFAQTVALGNPGPLNKGERVELTGTVQIPQDGPHTLSVMRNAVGWSLRPKLFTPAAEQSLQWHWIAVMPETVDFSDTP